LMRYEHFNFTIDMIIDQCYLYYLVNVISNI
jgi:hypothetical protein